MPSLIPEILFAIGKKLVEDGDSEGVIRFALSGKGPLKAMKNVYASAEYFKLYYNGYILGWDVSKCVKEMEIDKTHSKFLMKCIGNSVIDLDVQYYYSNSDKQIIDKIIARKQLISFSISSFNYTAAQSFIDEFLPQCSSTLKHVSLPSKCMTLKFRDSLNLDSLTITDNAGDDLPLFCCKTTSLTFKKSDCLQHFDRFAAQYPKLSPALSSIKQLTFDCNIASYQFTFKFEDPMKYFPSLELMKYLFSYYRLFEIRVLILCCIVTITSLVKVPAKVVIEICRFTENYKLTKLVYYKEVCDEYELEYDQSISDFYCFRKTVQSRGSQSTILEVRFPK